MPRTYISVGGMAFITPVPLNPAEQVAIKLNIPGHSTNLAQLPRSLGTTAKAGHTFRCASPTKDALRKWLSQQLKETCRNQWPQDFGPSLSRADQIVLGVLRGGFFRIH